MLSKISGGSTWLSYWQLSTSREELSRLHPVPVPDPQYIMVIFNVVLIFTRVMIKEAMSLLNRHFEDILRLFCHVLTSSYFNFGSQLYQQTDSMAMDLLLSPITANFFMEDFEKMALNQATRKSLCWFCYMDDTFVIWPQGPDRLRDFLDHLNSVHQNIQFIMKMERGGHLPFLDIGIYRRPSGSMGLENSLFAIAYRLALESTLPFYPISTRGSSSGGKHLGCEAHHSLQPI
jgi:hypothetical protein